MNVETYDEGMESDTKSEDYSSSQRNVGRHGHSHRNVGTHIKGMESDTRYGDYSSSRGDCSIVLVCNTTKERIKPGSCQFT